MEATMFGVNLCDADVPVVKETACQLCSPIIPVMFSTQSQNPPPEKLFWRLEEHQDQKTSFHVGVIISYFSLLIQCYLYVDHCIYGSFDPFVFVTYVFHLGEKEVHQTDLYEWSQHGIERTCVTLSSSESTFRQTLFSSGKNIEMKYFSLF